MTVYETADPGVIIAEYDAHGTVTSTGRHYQLRYVQVVEVREGRITLWRDYFDFYDMLKATARGFAALVLPSLKATF